MLKRLFSGLFDSKAGDWRESYDSAADVEEARMRRASDADLLNAIRQGNTGEYYTIWRTIGSRSATPEACWTLYDVLLSERPYLDKYHCATALLQLLRCKDFESVQLSAEWPEVKENLLRLKKIVAGKVGQR